MKEKNKAILVTLLIVLGNLAFVAFYVVIHTIKHWGWPWGYFTFIPDDRFMDFFNINQMVSNGSPYIHFGSSYPPLILVIARIFARFSDYTTYLPMEVRGQENGMFSLWLCMGLFTLGISIFAIVILYRKKKELKSAITITLLLLAMLLSAPYIYMVDRGNYLIIAIFFMMGFAAFYDRNDVIAAIFLGLAAAVKIYPIFFLLLYIIDKKWKPMLVFLATAIGSSVITMFAFMGGYMENVKSLLAALINFGGGKEAGPSTVYYSVGLTSAIRYFFIDNKDSVVPADFPVMKIYLISGTVLTLFSAFCMRKEQEFYKKLLVLSALMIFLTPNSYTYNLCYLIPPILCYVAADPDKHKVTDFVYAVLLVALMLPKTYIWKVPEVLVSVSVIVDAGLLLLLILYYALFDRSTRKVAKKA